MESSKSSSKGEPGRLEGNGSKSQRHGSFEKNSTIVRLLVGLRAREVSENSTNMRLTFRIRRDCAQKSLRILKRLLKWDAMTLRLPCACVTRVGRATKSCVVLFLDARSSYKWTEATIGGVLDILRATRACEMRFPPSALQQRRRFPARFSRRRRFLAVPERCVNKMLDTESYYSDSRRAFEGESALESLTAGRDSADFEGTEVVGGIEVSTELGSTSSVEVVEINNSQPSTSDHRVEATEADVSVADLGEDLLTVVTRRQWVSMVKPKGPIFGVDFIKLNTFNKAELAKIKVEYHIPDSVVMRIPGPLESLSNVDGEVVFFTDVFKHGLRLPLRHSIQKILAQIGYAHEQFNPNFWITLLGMITAFDIADEVERSYEQFTNMYSVTRAKSADQGGWVQSNCLSAGQRGHFMVGGSQKTWRQRRKLVSGACESTPWVIVERYIPTTFQTIVSLKLPTTFKRDIEMIERIQPKIAEEDHFFKTLLDFGNLFKAGLISEPEHA
ncbi:hypothetical protein L3X38_024955 [Prunus dulcis]|uniref:Uncharacterized protein n=1 Tax=Prunus dulcis TaxID=3755 RepID=A0AAD4Z5W6_PRUDU|nr:hypothetical protein L3X38_024955 [Prunus dulcis]